VAGVLALALAVPPAASGDDDPWLPPPAERTPRPPDRPLWIAAGALTAATVFDVESTFAALDACRGTCTEGNVFGRGVVASGRGWTYGMQLTLAAGLTYTSWRMRRSTQPMLRRAWWLPMALGGAMHLVGGLLNVRLAREARRGPGA
jgi:hypothetical protein